MARYEAAGGGADATPAQDVVAEIEVMGGEAVVNGGNVAVFDEAGAMVQQAIDTFGDINIIVNNAGILRDRMLFSMSEDDWDAVGAFERDPRTARRANLTELGARPM